MTARDYVILPRDGFFFNSAKGWYTAASGKAAALEWPFPSTIRGALRTACGRATETATGSRFTSRDWENKTAGVHVEFSLPVRRRIGESWGIDHLMWRCPADAVGLESHDEMVRLDPKKPVVPTLGMVDDAREKLWRPLLQFRAKPLPQVGFWTHREMVEWLSGMQVKKGDPDERESRRLPVRLEPHVTLKADTLTAEDGGLFSAMIRETLVHHCGNIFEWGILVRSETGTLTPEEVVTLGGDRRLARLETVGLGLDALPQVLANSFSKGSDGFRILCASPACFENGWLPDGFEATDDGESFVGKLPGLASDIILRAAIVPRPEHVSGWDMAKDRGRGAPKPSLRLVPAGSVYFFTKQDGSSFTPTDAETLWLSVWGQNIHQGYGRVVPGVWTPEA